MNERIKELAYQAEDYADGIVDQGGEFHQAYSQKFAELIIRECAKFLEDNSGQDQCNNSWYPEPEELLEHFGVK
jgi:hypothetical protein